MTIGEEIRAMRLRAKMTQERLATVIGVAQPRLAEWEADACEPRLKTFRLIQEACRRRRGSG